MELYSLFSLGFFVIIVSTLRLPVVVDNHAIQRWRTLVGPASTPASYPTNQFPWQFASIEMAAACGVANAPVLYRLIVDGSQKMHSSVQTRSSAGGAEAPRYWFSVNRTSRRTREATENDELEFTGLREAPMAVGKNPSEVDVGAWEAEDDRSWEWRARRADVETDDGQELQPAGLAAPPAVRKAV